MHVSSFINNPDDVSLHTNKYAHGTISMQSFAQRKAVEQSRSVIGSYLQSRISTSYITRPTLQKPKPRTSASDSTTISSNRTVPTIERSAKATFHEPPARKYNPYA